MPEQRVYDFMGSFPLGVNSGVDPLLLQKNQLAFAINATNRGDFYRQRPSRRKLTLTGSAGDLSDFQIATALFQATCYYRSGNQQLILVMVGGKLFSITPGATTASVVKIALPDSLNDNSTLQDWMWQSERWVIIQDGIHSPLIYDGSSVVRTTPTPVTLAVTSGAESPPPTVPGFNESTPVDIVDAWPADLNENVLLIDSSNNLIGMFAASPVSVSPSSVNATIQNNSGGSLSLTAGTTLYTYVAGSTSTTDETVNGTVYASVNDPSYNSSSVAASFGSITLQAGGQSFVATATNGQSVTVPISYYQDIGGSFFFRGSGTATGIYSGGHITGISPSHPYPNFSTDYRVTGNASAAVSHLFTGVTSTTPATWTAVATLLNAMPSLANGASTDITLSSPINGWTAADTVVVSSNASVPPINQFTLKKYVPGSTTNAVTLKTISAVKDTPILVGTRIVTLPGIPVGRMGAYGMGRNWVSLPDGVSFVASDIVGSSSGTLAENFKDAVLYMTQNNSLASGGSFSIPGAGEKISAMKFTASLDASLGQGFLQVFTNDTVFSCNAPTDIAAWSTTTNPILTESLIGSGAASQSSVSQENADLLFRSPDGGVRSLLLARLDFNRWGNTPISREMVRSYRNDNLALLPFACAWHFNNRRFELCQPSQTSRGVVHAAMMVLNFDSLSSMAGKQPAVWEAEWSVPNALALVGGDFAGTERCFIICNNSNQLELHEILKDESATDDNAGDVIQWTIETPVLFSNQDHVPKRLIDGELYFRDLSEPVNASVYYKPDQNSSWQPWYSTNIPVKANDSTYRPRVGLGQPNPKVFDSSNGKPMREGYSFQLKLVITGACTLVGGRFACDIIPQPEFAQPGKT